MSCSLLMCCSLGVNGIGVESVYVRENSCKLSTNFFRHNELLNPCIYIHVHCACVCVGVYTRKCRYE